MFFGIAFLVVGVFLWLLSTLGPARATTREHISPKHIERTRRAYAFLAGACIAFGIYAIIRS